MLIRSGRVIEVDVSKFDLTPKILNGTLALVCILVNSWLPVDDVESQFSSNAALCDSLDIRCSHTDRKHTENDSEEATQNVTCRIDTSIGVIPEIFVDPHTAHVEGVSIGSENASKEKRHCEGTSAMSLDTSLSGSLKVLGVVSHFLLLLTVGCNYSNSI